MTPIEKNIIIVDEQGNEYGRTWPKRAKGLVRKGRARFMDEMTICLACSPDENWEDYTLNENKELELERELTPEEKEALTVSDILEKIETLIKDSDYLNAIIEQVRSSDAAKGEVLQQIVLARETTYQRVISFYEKVYEDLSPKTLDGEKRAQYMLEAVSRLPELVEGAPSPDYGGMIAEIKNAF